jgi:hypothetical protein
MVDRSVSEVGASDGGAGGGVSGVTEIDDELFSRHPLERSGISRIKTMNNTRVNILDFLVETTSLSALCRRWRGGPTARSGTRSAPAAVSAAPTKA